MKNIIAILVLLSGYAPLFAQNDVKKMDLEIGGSSISVVVHDQNVTTELSAPNGDSVEMTLSNDGVVTFDNELHIKTHLVNGEISYWEFYDNDGNNFQLPMMTDSVRMELPSWIIEKANVTEELYKSSVIMNSDENKVQIGCISASISLMASYLAIFFACATPAVVVLPACILALGTHAAAVISFTCACFAEGC